MKRVLTHRAQVCSTGFSRVFPASTGLFTGKARLKAVLRASSLKLVCFSLLLTVCAAWPAQAQDPAKLNLDQLSRLEDKADEVIEVIVDEKTLKLALPFLKPERSTDEAIVKDLVKDLKGVYVKVFKFKGEGEYSMADVEDIRQQLRAPNWTRIVGVRSNRRGGDNVEVSLMSEGEKILGLGLIIASADELVVVNVVGPIDLQKLSQLEGRFGIPRLDLNLDFVRKIK
jgi:hypothetical protein